MITERETVALRRELANTRDDTIRYRILRRIFDLESTTPLSRRSARNDLNAIGFYKIA
jgi:hypothetical protein